MLSEKEFNDAFTAAGGWFILTVFETVHNWSGTKSDLIDSLFALGFDSKIKGTKTRVSSLVRIIENDMGKEALLKIQNSKIINKSHPDAYATAKKLISEYYNS